MEKRIRFVKVLSNPNHSYLHRLLPPNQDHPLAPSSSSIVRSMKHDHSYFLPFNCCNLNCFRAGLHKS
ncbi:hypothetical protein LINPERHAP1_LOCUS14885 [Linum perenne]